jgi:hypothetical protein
MLEESVLILSFGFPMEGPKNRIKLFFEGHRIQVSQNNSVSYIQIGLQIFSLKTTHMIVRYFSKTCS